MAIPAMLRWRAGFSLAEYTMSTKSRQTKLSITWDDFDFEKRIVTLF